MVMHLLYCKPTGEDGKDPGSGGDEEKERLSHAPGRAKGPGSGGDAEKESLSHAPGREKDRHCSCTQLLQVKKHRYADDMINWCGSFFVIGTCAGFIALILYFFASSSIGVGIFVVMIVFPRPDGLIQKLLLARIHTRYPPCLNPTAVAETTMEELAMNVSGRTHYVQMDLLIGTEKTLILRDILTVWIETFGLVELTQLFINTGISRTSEHLWRIGRIVGKEIESLVVWLLQP
ncbi:hypothetical protein K438DRAFT_1778184 [Mycena galopus ATCC 62051]|nr:hypothetical protein K438DRAFT_1778184 [Mycena galopus ATCC 62051]